MGRVAIVALVLVLAACGDGGGDESADLPVLTDPYEAIRSTLEASDVNVCDETPGTGDISGSYESLNLDIATRSCVIEGYMEIDRYNDPDTAAEVAEEPIGDAYLTWLIDPTTVASTGQSAPPEMLAALKQAFSAYEIGGPGAS